MAIVDNKVYTIKIPQEKTIQLKIAKKTYQIRLPQIKNFIIKIKDFPIIVSAFLLMNLQKTSISLNPIFKWAPNIYIILNDIRVSMIAKKIISPSLFIDLNKIGFSMIPGGYVYPNLSLKQTISFYMEQEFLSLYVYKTLDLSCGINNITFSPIVGREKLLSDYDSVLLSDLDALTLARMEIS